MNGNSEDIVGYLGPDPTTFGYAAAIKFLGDGIHHEMRPFKTHTKIIEAVSKTEISRGIVAIENVIDGHVPETVHAMERFHRKFGVSICAEVELPVEMLFLRKAGSTGKPTKVFSHPTALRQCSQFISGLQAEGIAVEVRDSTGQAAKEASENADFAVLASPLAQEHYQLVRVSETSVADCLNNKTRFWVVAKNFHEPTGNDKTCFLINLDRDKSGVLYKSLGFFAERNICILCVYPNPIPGRDWEYTFVVEIRGHILDENVDSAYSAFESSGVTLGAPLILGSYPSVTIRD